MRMFLSVILASAAVGFLLGSSREGYSQSTPEGGALGILVPAVDGASRCYSLAGANDLQNGHEENLLAEVVLQLAYGKHPSSDDEAESVRAYYFSMFAKLAGRSDVEHASGECMNREGRIWCGVECDGGGFFADLQSDEALHLSFDPTDPRLRMTPGCSEADATELTPEVAGEVVTLDPAEMAICEAAGQTP